MIRRTVLCLAIATSALAQTNEVRQLPPVIITGTRIPEELSDTPNSVTVVSREQIDEQQQRTVADALREVAGVDIIRSGQPGQQTAAFLRGARGEQTLVLIDGVRVNNPFNNAFDFANLSVDNIDHIEVIRGPQSTLYGSEAIGGVINIVTKQCAGKPTGAVTVEGGSDDSLRAAGSFAGSFDKLYLSAESSYFTTDNERDNAYDRAWNASGHATYQLLDRLTANLLATYLESKAGSPNDKFTNDPNDFLHNENTLVALTLDGQPTEWWAAKLTLSYAHERGFFSGLEPNPPGFFGDFTELTVTDRDQADFQNIFTIAEGHKLLVGGTYDHSEADDASTFGTTRRSVDNRAAYAQYEFAALPRFTGTAGGRVDDYTTFGTHATYRFGGRFTTPVTETILRASVGTGFRAPTIRDFFPPFGNPNLKPEESLGWDAGFEQPAGNFRFGATYFQNELDDLIQFAFPAPLNTGKAETAGIETFASWIPITNLTLRSAYTWMPVAEDRVADARLVRRPEHAGSVSAAYKFLGRFTAAGNATFVGERRDQKFNPTTFTSTRVTNAGYVKLDLSLSCDVCKYFTVFGRAENLLDDRYEEAFGFPASGRTFWGGGTVRF
jgi:vitamin B12 transporter